MVDIAITAGELIDDAIAKHIGRIRFKAVDVVTGATLPLGLMGLATINSSGLVVDLVLMGTFSVSWNEAVVFPICSIIIPDQA